MIYVFGSRKTTGLNDIIGISTGDQTDSNDLNSCVYIVIIV